MKKQQIQEQYEGLLIRANSEDTGMLPREGDVSLSPDIISSRGAMIPDPELYFVETYGQAPGDTLDGGKSNFIYVRAKNTAPQLTQGDIYLYWALTSEVNDPNKWAENILLTQDCDRYVSVLAQTEGTIVGTDKPFVWITPLIEDDETYSLIAVVTLPGEEPDFSGDSGFIKYVIDHGNVGWRQVTIENPPPPIYPPLRLTTKFYYYQGDTSRTMRITMKTNGIPAGSYVMFSTENISGTDPDPAISLGMTEVSSSSFSVGLDSLVQAGYVGIISFAVFTENEIAEGATISFTADYPDPESTSGPTRYITQQRVTNTIGDPS